MSEPATAESLATTTAYGWSICQRCGLVPKMDHSIFDHYQLNTAPTHEFGELPQCQPTIKNIGWTLGNDCPYRCTHCYSMNARLKGQNMSIAMVDRVVAQLALNGVETVNLGGNEPLFTNGLSARASLLPYIIRSLTAVGIRVGLTTSGVTILHLYRHERECFDLLNDVDISLDSPFPAVHNHNRGAEIYDHALESLRICQAAGKQHSVILCAMNWNFDADSIDALVKLARTYDANIRINPLKPTVQEHMRSALPSAMYYEGFARLMELCDPIDLGEPPLAAVTEFAGARGCPCGRTSFRIHSIAPTGEIYVSPCVYLHDYKSPLDLLEHDLAEVVNSAQFRVFRQRNRNAAFVEGCSDCELLPLCRGGCTARSFLYARHTTNRTTLLMKDPYCPKEATQLPQFPRSPKLVSDIRLVHMDYLCTWIGRPKQ